MDSQMKKFASKKFNFIVGAALVLAASTASAQVCTIHKGQQICTSNAASLARVTGISQSQAQAAQISYNAQQAAAKAKADAEAAKRQASYEAAQRTAASLAAETAKQAAALKAAQQKQNDQIALQQLAAKTAAQKTAADKAAADLAAKQQAAQQAVADRAKLANQVASQVTSSGASCNGYWQGGRCVNNGQVAYSGGSPVNVMNQPTSTWAGAGKRQTCTLVYTYKAGRVVGSPRSVCTIS
jgi:colicin import membrane protein